MRKKTAILVFLIGLCWIAICLIVAVCNASTTTFTTSTNSYYGKESPVNKLTVAIVPVHKEDVNDHNDVNSVDISDEIYGELRRITLAAAGTDVDFTVEVKDDKGITLFSKTDCNTTLLPLSYALTTSDTAGNKYAGQLVAGPLTVDTNYVDPNTTTGLTGIEVTLYYYNQRH